MRITVGKIDKLVGYCIMIASCVALVCMFFLFPLLILKQAVVTLINRPLGSGWIRRNAEIRTLEMSPEFQQQMQQENQQEMQQQLQTVLGRPLSELRYAEYCDEDGTEHRVPVQSFKGRQHAKIYVRQDHPEMIWDPKFENRFAALIGILLILLFWTGLVFAGIYIVRMIRS